MVRDKTAKRGGERIPHGQVTLEYVLVIAFAFVIILPGVYFFYLYSQGSAASLASSQYAKFGQEVIASAVETLAQGKGSWVNLDTIVPRSVLNITTSPDGRELIITYDTPYGPSDAVFFSDEANLSGTGVDGSLYAARSHGGRLTLLFLAGSNNIVQIGEVVGDWIAPQCASDGDCYTYAAGDLCFYQGSCSQQTCSYESQSKSGLPACTGAWNWLGSGESRQCYYALPAGHACTDAGWTCPESWLTDRCPVTGAYGDECWYKPVGVSSECNATGCQLAVDASKPCGEATCNPASGWDNSTCVICVDADHDGYNVTGASCGPVDCDDTNASIHPGAPELCADRKDNDCDNNIDELDNACAVSLALQPNVTTKNSSVTANLTALDGNIYYDSVSVLLCPTACHFCQSGMTEPTCTFQAPPSGASSDEAPWLSCDFTAPSSDGISTYRACLGENQASATLNVSCAPYYTSYDYNDDSALDGMDSKMLQEVVGGSPCPPGKTCDVDQSGTVNLADVSRLDAIIAGTYDDGENCTDGFDNNCDGLLDGADPSCTACGGEGEVCCAGKTCDASLSCCPKSSTCEKVCG